MNSWIHPYLKLDQAPGFFSCENRDLISVAEICHLQLKDPNTMSKGLVSGPCEIFRGTSLFC